MRNVIRAYNEAVFAANKGAPFETGGSNRGIPRAFFSGIPSCRVLAAQA